MKILSFVFKAFGAAISFYLQTIIFLKFNSLIAANFYTSLSIASLITAVAAGGALEFFTTRSHQTGDIFNTKNHLLISLCLTISLSIILFIPFAQYKISHASLETFLVTVLGSVNTIIAAYFGSKSFANLSLLPTILPPLCLLALIASNSFPSNSNNLLVYWIIGAALNLAIYMILLQRNGGGHLLELSIRIPNYNALSNYMKKLIGMLKSKLSLIILTVTINWFQSGIIVASSILLSKSELAKFSISLKYITAMYFITAIEQIYNSALINKMPEINLGNHLCRSSIYGLIKKSLRSIASVNTFAILIIFSIPIFSSSDVAVIFSGKSFKVALLLGFLVSLTTPFSTVSLAFGNAKKIVYSMLAMMTLEIALIASVKLLSSGNQIVYNLICNNLLLIHMLIVATAYILSIMSFTTRNKFFTSPTS